MACSYSQHLLLQTTTGCSTGRHNPFWSGRLVNSTQGYNNLNNNLSRRHDLGFLCG